MLPWARMAMDKVMAKIKSDLLAAKYETILCPERLLSSIYEPMLHPGSVAILESGSIDPE